MQLPGSGNGRRPPSFIVRTLLVLTRTVATFLSSLLQLPKVIIPLYLNLKVQKAFCSMVQHRSAFY